MVSKLIYIFLIAISILISALVAEKAVKKRKRKIPIAFAFFACLMIVFSVVSNPVINHIAKFKTPESIFKFTHTEELVGVVEGDESCMIVFRKDKNSYGQDYYLKSGDEYQLTRSFSTKEVASSVGKYGSCSIDNVRKTNDYYVVGVAIIEDGKNLTVTGNDNQVFQYTAIGDTLVLPNGKKQKDILFYSTFNDFSDDYCLTVNGEKISFNKS